jgi:hypothetical protein
MSRRRAIRRAVAACAFAGLLAGAGCATEEEPAARERAFEPAPSASRDSIPDPGSW